MNGSKMPVRFDRMTVLGAICWLTVGACFALSCYSSFRSGGFYRKILADIVRGLETSSRTPYARIDTLFESLAGDGNIFVRFRDFKSDNPRQTAFMTKVYFRGSYAAYPARVWVSRAGEIINNGRDIARLNQELDARLAEQLDISNLILFEFEDNTGNLRSRIIRIQP
jgi:hypothetical protein